MNVRAYEARDLERLKELHAAQGFGYPLPDLTDPTFVVGQVIDSGSQDSPLPAAAFLQLTAQAFFLQGKAGTPREKWQQLLALHEAVRSEAAELGLCDVQCWVPPEVSRGFDRRLKKLGWVADPWRNFTFRLR